MSDDDAQFYFPSSPPAPPVIGPLPPPLSTRRVSGGFGAGPFGSMSFGSGGGVSIADALQLTRNAIRLRISGPVSTFNPADVRDALYDRGYTLEVYNVPPGFGAVHVPRVAYVERAAADAIVLYTDSQLSGPGVSYRLIGSEAIFGPGDLATRSAVFRTFGEGRADTERRRTRSFDLANQQSGGADPSEPVTLGTLERDTDGDYKNDAGLANLKKRVIRRVTTRRGRFVHAPDYGLRIAEKTLITPLVLRDLQQQALQQIGQERGVTSVAVTVQEVRPGVVLMGLDVQANDQSFGLDIELPVGAES